MNIPKLKFLLLSLAMVCHLCHARWLDPPEVSYQGMHTIGEMAPHTTKANIHVRASRGGSDTCVWGLIWDMIDTDNFHMARLTIPPADKQSDLFSQESVLEVIERAGGQDRVVSRQTLHGDDFSIDGFNSLRLIHDRSASTLYVGSELCSYSAQVPFGGEKGGVVAYFSEAPVKVQRVSVSAEAPKQIEMSEYVSESDIMAHLLDSSDPVEEIWTYLDRNTHPDKSQIGGRYRLAIVANSTGGYDMVYLGGAEVYSQLWPQMSIKGRLKPTIFSGNYDLSWTDATGSHTLADDCNAQLSEQDTILTLFFPSIGAQIRFKREK